MERIVEPTTVYNLACEPAERYFANGLLVHNCSYGSGPESVRAAIPNPPRALWKNQVLNDTRASLSQEKMLETIDAMARLGVKAVEVTGGGEPTVYAHFDALVAAIGRTKMEFAMVTNGTRITAARAEAMGHLPFVWVRVSIDAGSPEDYVATRHVPESHWDRAWESVVFFAREKRQRYAHPESTVGVGFVVDRMNWRGVYDACLLAKGAGADNIRISASFTPDHMDRFDAECRASVPRQVARAKAELEDDSFRVNDLSAERWHNIALGRQEYAHCAWKDVGCVVGADGNVYSCCSLAFNRAGLMYSIAHQDFATGWYGDGAAWRREHDARRMCKITCLYERRNVEALRLMGDRSYAAEVADRDAPAHRNFL